ncbi:NAD(P)-binding domain-containing protein [Isobaculum melis]|nr:NAD(P)-binding domain-containing protein [Isobaculum melis]
MPIFNEDIAFFSTTAKVTSQTNILPEKMVLGKARKNYLFSSKADTEAFFQENDVPKHLFVDVENKRDFDLKQTIDQQLENVTPSSQIHAYKPNDVTMEAADLLISKLMNDDVAGKNILIFGAGNLGAKLSIRLAERNAHVSIWNLHADTAQTVIDGINLFLPRFSPKITFYQEIKDHYDLAISFISAEQVIDAHFLSVMKEKAFVIDGGISNYTSSFIADSESKKIRMLRLDVRMADEYLAFAAQSRLAEGFYEMSIGEREINGMNIVSGGIIGRCGEVVVDSYLHPTRIVGIANGLGGLLNAEEYTQQQQQDIERIRTELF